MSFKDSKYDVNTYEINIFDLSIHEIYTVIFYNAKSVKYEA